MVPVGLVIAQQVGAVEHQDPGAFGILLKGGGGPVGEGVLEGNLFAHDGPAVGSAPGAVQEGFQFGQGGQAPVVPAGEGPPVKTNYPVFVCVCR